MHGASRFRGPETVRTREELAEAVTGLRESAGLTVRELALQSGVPHGTVGSWSAGHHVPTRANEPMFRRLLAACGVTSDADQQQWLAAVARVRRTAGRRSAENPPYPGLLSFQEADTRRFFGRADLTEQLRTRVRTAIGGHDGNRIVFVIGASGSGKSSLLRAGLIPALREDDVEVSVIVPGRHPLESLQAAPDTAAVLVIDQFEETWTQCHDEAERREFLDVIADDDGPVVVLGLRADFFGSAAAEPALVAALDARASVVGPLTEQALRQVITEPARQAGYRVEPELVHRLLADLAPSGGSRSAHDVGALPLLSHALLETWRRAEGNTLTVAGYEATGGIAGAVHQCAEAVFEQLPEDQRQIARRVVVRLVDIDGETPTRRRVHRSELSFDDTGGVDTVLDRFARSRLVTVEAHTIAISHEALISAWNRLAEWVSTGRDELVLHRRLTRAAHTWDDSDRDPSMLLGPVRLPAIREWIDSSGRDSELNAVEREFLAASAEHLRRARDLDQRRRRRLQQLVAALALLLVAALVAGVIAFQQRGAARFARDQAVSRQIAGEAVRLRDSDPALAAQLALAAYRVQPTVEARSALLDSSATPTPVRLAGPPGNTLVTPGAHDDFVVWAADGSTSLLRAGSGPPSLADTSLPVLEPQSSLALGRDGTSLVRTSGTTIEIWDVGDWHAPVRRWATTRPDAVTSVAFGADGRTLLAGTERTTILRWNIDDPAHPTELASLDLPGGNAVVAAQAAGTLLAAGGKDRALRVWDVTRPDAAPVLDLPPDGSADNIQALRFSPDGSTLAAGMRSAQVRRWRFAPATPPTELPPLGGFTSYVNDLAFTPDGTRLAAASSDNSVRVWTLADDALELTLPNSAVVGSLGFGGNRLLVTGSTDGIARVWPLPGPVLRGARYRIGSTRFDRTGTALLAVPGRGDPHSYFWNLTDPRAPGRRQPLAMAASDQQSGAAALTPDASLAAIGSTGGRVYLWDLTDPAPAGPLASIPAVASVVADVAFTPDGKTLVAAGQDGPVITIWNLTKPAEPRQVASIDTGTGRPRNIAIDHAGRLLAVSTSDRLVRLWNLGDPLHPRQLAPLSGFDGAVNTVAISPDDALLAAGGQGSAVHLVDITDPGNPHALSQLTGPNDSAYSLDFNPGGTVLARGGNDGVWLWDVTDTDRPHTLANLTAHHGRVNDARFGHDGELLAGGGAETTVHLWSTDPDQVAADICHSGSTPLTTAEWNRYSPDYPLPAQC